MTSYDGSVPAAGSAGRRRALGRGPGGSSLPPGETEASAPPEAEELPSPPAEVGPPAAEPEPPAAEAVSPSAESPSLVEDSTSAADRGALCPPSPTLDSARAGGPPSPRGTPAHNAGEPAAADTAAPAASGAPRVDAEPDDGTFKVRLANFEGPFDLLLQLISKHKLDVTEVALSKVTDEFMAHIRAMGPDWDLDETTEFLVVAATLLDLKAARLLPSAEVEDEADLALLEARDLLFARLLQYRAYKQIAEIFSGRLEEEARRYPRTVGLEPHHAELLPEVVISIGAEGFAKLAVKAMQPKPKPQVYVDHIHAPLVSVQEQAGIVVARLRELGEASFRALVEDTDDTLTVVARFLALLELYREKAVTLDQEEALGELLVRWTGGDSDEEPRVTDEFDRPPEPVQDEAKEEKA
ncbi:segregation and condensation protein A [Streptomyces sp. NBC_00286]|uniref:segregation and condensation protein A n=1 Tax=Streptomyces sp. NBC_00286 TaxID=2975701 RepID=UPI002E2B772B|nr:segregation/condensation protein A [Streptomyces sp. NBC_00286]